MGTSLDILRLIDSDARSLVYIETNISIQSRVPVAVSLWPMAKSVIHIERLRKDGQEEK